MLRNSKTYALLNEHHGHISHGKYFSKKKKIDAMESYARELDKKASDIREYIKELGSTN